MKDGRIVSYGKADEVLTSESLRKVYDFDVAGYAGEPCKLAEDIETRSTKI